ncbi:MAG TPA: DUF502 domain-containing protein [Candidatus Acidoferrales bacterium]|nr:DUF502 domain-containing protein [Candidatus Acidoferrales bacterium]
MPQDVPRRHPLNFNVQTNVLVGLLTITPLIVVWLIFDFLLGVLAHAGAPLAAALADFVGHRSPEAAIWLSDRAIRWVLAVVVALLLLYAVGAFASRVVGERLIALFESLLIRIPLVDVIYSATKKLVELLSQKPDSTQRVVLVDFPHQGLKTLAFVMRTFPDAKTGEELAAIYVPSALNPTSGFLEIMPVANLIPTDIPPDQAMTMVISGGAIAPENLTLSR